MTIDRKALLESSPYESDDHADIGRDPREIGAAGLNAAFLTKIIGMKAIRAKCLDCCSGSQGEVRKCTAVDCALWPLRMGSNPWNKP